MNNFSKIHLIEKLKSIFLNGIKYSDSIDLCVVFYCSTGWLLDVYEEDFSKENITKTFSQLANEGLITDFDPRIANARAAFSDHKTKEHWIELIQFSLRNNQFYDSVDIKKILSKNQ